MESKKGAEKAIDKLDGHEFKGQKLEVRFSDSDTAKQYPSSKFTRKRGDRDDRGGRGGHRGRGDFNNDLGRGRGYGRGGRGDDQGVKRRNTYDYDKRREYDRGRQDDYYYDEEDEEYYIEDDRYDRGHGNNSYRRQGE